MSKRSITLLSLLSLLLAGCDAAGDGPPDPAVPAGRGGVRLALDSAVPLSAEWTVRIRATQRECAPACSAPVEALAELTSDLTIAVVFLPPGTWDLEIAVLDLNGVALFLGDVAGLTVLEGRTTTAPVTLTAAAGGVQVSADISLGAERFTCVDDDAALPPLAAGERLAALHGAEEIQLDGALTWHLFAVLADTGTVLHVASDRPDAFPGPWQPTELHCGAGRLEDVTAALGGFLALCHDPVPGTLELRFSSDALSWSGYGAADYEARDGDALRSCALVVDNQFNLFCSAVDGSAGGAARAGLVRAWSPDGSDWSELLPYDPDAAPGAPDVRFEGLVTDLVAPDDGLQDVRVAYAAGVYLLWGTWGGAGGTVTVHARSIDRHTWRFAGPESVTDRVPPVVAAGGTFTCGATPAGLAWCAGGGQNIFGDGGPASLTPSPIAQPAGWTTLSAGYLAICGVLTDRSLWCWGNNIDDQLGTGTWDGDLAPVAGGAQWSAVSVGYEHTCALRLDGSLWCWGTNTGGQIGDGSTDTRPLPTAVEPAVRWDQASAGGFHSCAIRRGGGLWCWGWNAYGQLGDGTTDDRGLPAPIAPEQTWRSVSAGFTHTCAVRTDGTLWCWGSAGSGELGLGAEYRNQPSPVRIGAATDWTRASCGEHSTCGIRRDGSLWCAGLDVAGGAGRVGDLTRRSTGTGAEERWQAVSLGNGHACAVRGDGTLWCWGDNYGGGTALGVTAGHQLFPARVRVGTDPYAVDPHVPLAARPVVFAAPGGAEGPRWVMLAGAAAGLPVADGAPLRTVLCHGAGEE